MPLDCKQSLIQSMQNNRGPRGDVEDVWEHDRYDDEEEDDEVGEIVTTSGGGGGGRGLRSAGIETGAKLQISNLAFSVNDDDIKVFYFKASKSPSLHTKS